MILLATNHQTRGFSAKFNALTFTLTTTFGLIFAAPAFAAAASPLVPVAPAAAGAAPQGPDAAASDDMVVRTDVGDFVIALDASLAPKAVAQIHDLLSVAAFSGGRVSYILKGFVAQIDTSDDAAEAPVLAAEFHPEEPVTRGTVMMSRDEDHPDSARSSFFIALTDQPDLQGKYTVIGHVTDGSAVLSSLEHVEVDDQSHPVHPLVVTDTQLITSPVQRFGLTLAAAKDFTDPSATPSKEPPIVTLLLGCFATCIGLGLFGLVVSRWLGPAVLRSVAIASVLVAATAVLAVIVPKSAGNAWAGAGLFIVFLAVIKLLGQFESSKAG